MPIFHYQNTPIKSILVIQHVSKILTSDLSGKRAQASEYGGYPPAIVYYYCI